MAGLCASPRSPSQQAGFLLQQHHFDQIADGFRVRDDVVAHGARAELLARHAGGFEHAQFAFHELRVVQIRRAQQPRLREFGEQHAQLVGFGQAGVIFFDSGALEQFGDHRFVDVRALPQVDAGEVEAEHFGGTRERRQTRARQRRAVMLGERIDQHMQVARERVGVLVRLRAHRGRAAAGAAQRHRAFAEPHARACREPRIDADQRTAIRLIDAVRRLVRRRGGQFLHCIARARQQVRHRELGAELVHLLQIMFEDHRGLARDRFFQRRGGHVRVAVAVAANPAAHLEERRQTGVKTVLDECRFDIRIQGGDFFEEGRAVVRQRVLDFIGHRQARVAQHPRLPQRGDAGAQHGFVVRALAVGELLVTFGKQAGDVVLGVENALALHFGRVRGEHRHDQRVVEELLQDRRGGGVGFHQPFERIGDRAGLRGRTGQRVDAVTAVAMTVFGDVRQMRKIAERPHDAHGLLGAQRAQLLVERLRGAAVVFAAKPHGVLADRLDHVEDLVAFLLAHHVAEQPSQIADVLEERLVFVLARAAAGFLRGRRCLFRYRMQDRCCRAVAGLRLRGLGGFARRWRLVCLVCFACLGWLVCLGRFAGLLGLGRAGGAAFGQGAGRGRCGRGDYGRTRRTVERCSVAAGRARRSGRRHDGFPQGSQGLKRDGLLLHEYCARTANCQRRTDCDARRLRRQPRGIGPPGEQRGNNGTGESGTK